mgnify:CR=1 FL=1
MVVDSKSETYRILCHIRNKKGKAQAGVDLSILDPGFLGFGDDYDYKLADIQYLVDKHYVTLSKQYTIQQEFSKSTFYYVKIDKPGLDFIDEHERTVESQINLPKKAITISWLAILIAVVSLVVSVFLK